MSDTQKIAAEVDAASAAGREISDACARVIASQWYSENAGASFVTTGAVVTDPDTLWRILFVPEYENGSMTAADKRAADMLGTYLVRHGQRGPVDGWSRLWL
jgi:hypothetical protein